jgi:hypothetical protein
MIKNLKRKYLQVPAAFTVGMMAAAPAHAGGAGGTNFSTIATNVTASMASLPGLLSALAYLFGIILGVLGVMKIKDHVENPSQTPLKDGAIRLAAGGALFALPIVYSAMFNTVDNGVGGTTDVAILQKVKMGV